MLSCKTQVLFAAATAAALHATPAFARVNHDDTANLAVTDRAVYRSDGKYLGADPDARVRFELSRDAHASDN